MGYGTRRTGQAEKAGRVEREDGKITYSVTNGKWLDDPGLVGMKSLCGGKIYEEMMVYGQLVRSTVAIMG
jgi:hypothetical protein